MWPLRNFATHFNIPVLEFGISWVDVFNKLIQFYPHLCRQKSWQHIFGARILLVWFFCLLHQLKQLSSLVPEEICAWSSWSIRETWTENVICGCLLTLDKCSIPMKRLRKIIVFVQGNFISSMKSISLSILESYLVMKVEWKAAKKYLTQIFAQCRYCRVENEWNEMRTSFKLMREGRLCYSIPEGNDINRLSFG